MGQGHTARSVGHTARGVGHTARGVGMGWGHTARGVGMVSWEPGHHLIRMSCVESWTSSLAGGKKLGIEGYWLETTKDNPALQLGYLFGDT